MVIKGRSYHVEDRRLRSRVKVWSALSLLLLAASLVMIFQGYLFMDIDGRTVGLGQMIWLPSLIGSCSGLWLLMTMAGARPGLSLPISIAALAGAEFFALVVEVREVSGMAWEPGNGLIPALSFAALALTSITWTATGLIDPLRSNRAMYAVAMAAAVMIGLILSYMYFWSLQGVMATGLASALFWGAAYDDRLHRYSKGGRKRWSVSLVFMATFMGLPMLLLGVPFLLQ